MRWKFVSTVFPILISTAFALAQPETCPTLVAGAISTAGEACSAISRNQACYGNVAMTVTPRDAGDELDFAEPGDTVDVADVQSLDLTALDPDAPEWGVALMALQANLPGTLPGQNLTIVLFGDVAVEDTGDDDAVPMQAFTLRTGIGAPACSEAPASGILIQTPDGAAEVTFDVNGVSVTLGSTAVVRAVAGNAMRFTILEGFSTLEFDGGDPVTVLPFKTAVVALDEDGEPIGDIVIEDALPADWAALPLELLPRQVTTPPADGGTTPYAIAFEPPLGSSDSTVLAGEWSYETVDVDDSECPVGSATTGATGTVRIMPAEDGTFSLFNVDFTFDGKLWRGTGEETSNGVTAEHTYEITFDGEHATAILTSDIQSSPIGACVIRWTAEMEYLGG